MGTFQFVRPGRSIDPPHLTYDNVLMLHHYLSHLACWARLPNHRRKGATTRRTLPNLSVMNGNSDQLRCSAAVFLAITEEMLTCAKTWLAISNSWAEATV
jgi:hypothetical protein